MAERDHIGIDTFGGVAWRLHLGRGFFQGRCRCRSGGSFGCDAQSESFGCDTQIGDNHIDSIFGHAFSFTEQKNITR